MTDRLDDLERENAILFDEVERGMRAWPDGEQVLIGEPA